MRLDLGKTTAVSTALSLFLALGGCAAETPPGEATITKDDGRAMGGKSDEDVDICDVFAWYGDGECDEFCPRYDAEDCEAECATGADCPPIFCIRAPCPFSTCVDGQCRVENPGDACAAGERECRGCDGAVTCVAQREPCPVVDCPPATTACGSRGLDPCPEGQFCDFPTTAACGATDLPGACTEPPGACTREYDPVCGCDSTTYSNACEARAARTSVATLGECE